MALVAFNAISGSVSYAVLAALISKQVFVFALFTVPASIPGVPTTQ